MLPEEGNASHPSNDELCFANFLPGRPINFAVIIPRSRIRRIEGNAKCRHLKKLIGTGTLRQIFIFLRTKPHTPPLTLCTRVYVKYTYTGKEGGGRADPKKRLEGHEFTKTGSKIPT